MDSADRELINLHLNLCPPCREDVRSFEAFRDQITPEMSVSYAPTKTDRSRRDLLSWISWWRALAWKPIYATAAILIGIAILVGIALLVKQRAGNQQAHQVPTPQVSPLTTPDGHAANFPSPIGSANESPKEEPNSAEAMIVLNDRGGTITVDKAGKVSGLDDVSESMRNKIAQVLLSGRIARPPILKDLGAEDSALRGNNRDQPFKLISPARSVIVSNRPAFRWESVSGASAYSVYITDTSGQIIAKSGELAPNRREWLASKPLSRGAIYAWSVSALVDGKEITAPGPSAPEMKFQILSDANLAQLNQPKRVQSHLALGLFYAKVGLIAEAERDLEEVVRQNPSSESTRELIRQIRSWRNR